MKSSLLEALLPSADLFLDDLPAPTTKDAQLLLHGPVIVEIAELAAFKKAENERMKAFITTRIDRLRPPYGRAIEHMPRRCVFAGTTNDQRYLTDQTGNRRYWPVRVRAASPTALALVRDQLWAEALVACRQGCKHYFDDAELEALAAGEQSQRLETDPWEEMLVPYVRHREAVMQALAKIEDAAPSERASAIADLHHLLPVFAPERSSPYVGTDVSEQARSMVRGHFPGHRHGPTQSALYESALKITEADRRTRATDRRIREIMTRHGYELSLSRDGDDVSKIWRRAT